MIRQLTIKNLAIIDDISIDFEDHLNVLTGETGAGKSIIIDALSLIFGARSNTDIVSYDKESAYISVSLEIDDNKAKMIQEMFDIDVTDECIITRIINKNGKNSLKINGQLIPLYTLNQLSYLLIDISLQNESQYLLDHKNHLSLLDRFVAKSNPDYLDKYKDVYERYKEAKEKLDNLKSKQINQDEIEFLKFKYQELKDYNYTPDDETNLVNEYKNLESIAKNASLYEEIIDYLDNDNNGVSNSLYEAIKMLSKLSNNPKINEYYEKFNSSYLDLTDLIDSFKKEFSSNNVDFNQIEYLSNEITRINRLKRKYNTNDLLSYKKELENQIDELENREIIISKLEKSLEELKKIVEKEASYLSTLRKEKSLELASKVRKELEDLYLKDVSFSIHFERLDEYNSFGFDDVSFYMSANKGVPEKPLIKVASGGETSRIMLGLKSIFTTLAGVDTIIFDEIDSGVSGKVALAMGKKMLKIAKTSQVLAITHLPQVAAMSDYHYYIYKINESNKTKTIVKKLDENAKINEVARLLSGDKISQTFIDSAKELINLKDVVED